MKVLIAGEGEGEKKTLRFSKSKLLQHMLPVPYTWHLTKCTKECMILENMTAC